MFTTLALIQQRLAAIRAAVEELNDLATAAERSETPQSPLLPLETQARLLLELDRLVEQLEKIGEEISSAVDPRLVRGDEPRVKPS
jgi:hypothetical protein